MSESSCSMLEEVPSERSSHRDGNCSPSHSQLTPLTRSASILATQIVSPTPEPPGGLQGVRRAGDRLPQQLKNELILHVAQSMSYFGCLRKALRDARGRSERGRLGAKVTARPTIAIAAASSQSTRFLIGDRVIVPLSGSGRVLRRASDRPRPGPDLTPDAPFGAQAGVLPMRGREDALVGRRQWATRVNPRSGDQQARVGVEVTPGFLLPASWLLLLPHQRQSERLRVTA